MVLSLQRKNITQNVYYSGACHTTNATSTPGDHGVLHIYYLSRSHRLLRPEKPLCAFIIIPYNGCSCNLRITPCFSTSPPSGGPSTGEYTTYPTNTSEQTNEQEYLFVRSLPLESSVRSVRGERTSTCSRTCSFAGHPVLRLRVGLRL